MYQPEEPETSIEKNSSVTENTSVTPQFALGFVLMQNFLGGRVEPLRKVHIFWTLRDVHSESSSYSLSQVLSIIQTAAAVLLPDENVQEADPSNIHLERAMTLCLKVTLHHLGRIGREITTCCILY